MHAKAENRELEQLIFPTDYTYLLNELLKAKINL
jgi:hypothetical protein